MTYPARCWTCGKGAQWTSMMKSTSGRLYGFCRKCGNATPQQVLSADVHKAETLEQLRRFVA